MKIIVTQTDGAPRVSVPETLASLQRGETWRASYPEVDLAYAHKCAINLARGGNGLSFRVVSVGYDIAITRL